MYYVSMLAVESIYLFVSTIIFVTGLFIFWQLVLCCTQPVVQHNTSSSRCCRCLYKLTGTTL